MIGCNRVTRLAARISIALLLTASPAIANPGDPNGTNNRPEAGWGLWFPRSQAAAANFDSGFSNSELGGFLDFEAACAEAGAGEPANYWFRLTNSVARMGTGSVENGCWQNGRFVAVHSSTAILADRNVTCLTARAIGSNGLNIRAEPSLQSRILRTVRNGTRLTPSAFPAIVQISAGRSWVQIQAPVRGWVSDDRPSSQGNLTQCDR